MYVFCVEKTKLLFNFSFLRIQKTNNITNPIITPNTSRRIDCSKLETKLSRRVADKIGIDPKEKPPRIAAIYPNVIFFCIVFNQYF